MCAPMQSAPVCPMFPMAPSAAPTFTYTAIFTDPRSRLDAVVPLVASPIFVHPVGVVIVDEYGFTPTDNTDRSPGSAPVPTAGFTAVTATVPVGVPLTRMLITGAAPLVTVGVPAVVLVVARTPVTVASLPTVP